MARFPAENFVAQIRRRLSEVNERLSEHPYLAALERKEFAKENLRYFAGEQYAIIGSDLRSLAHLLSRFGATPARGFFLDLLLGERAAADALLRFGKPLGWGLRQMESYEPHAGAHAYTGYMSWLALYGSAAEFASAILVNLPAWGANCGAMSRILKDNYEFTTTELEFLDLFATPSPAFERKALLVIQAGLDSGEDRRRLARAARLLQAYELMFWDALQELSG